MSAPPRQRTEARRAETFGDLAADIAAGYGLVLDDWQRDVLDGWLGTRRDGLWAGLTCGLAVPRQNGKNATLEVRELFGLLRGEKFLHTAHEVKTARKHFLRLQHFFGRKADDPAAKFPELNALVAEVRNVNGQEAIFLKNGGSVEIVARSKGSGRGFTVDCLVMDEAQELSDEDLEALMPTTSAAPMGNPQWIYTGTPPGPKARGEVFSRVRRESLSGRAKRQAWDEWSITAATETDDPKALAATNPALGSRLQAKVCAGERANMSEEGYRRERLGEWLEDSHGLGVISAADWSARLDPASAIVGDPVLVLDVSPMATHSCIVAGGMNADGRPHVEITSDGSTLDYRPGTDWAVSLLGAAVERRGSVTVWIVQGSAAEALVPRLEAVGVSVEFLKRADYAAACVQFASDLPAHLGQKPLTDAVLAGVKKGTDEGLWTWGRVKSSTDITPLVGATAAAWLASSMNINADPLSSFK